MFQNDLHHLECFLVFLFLNMSFYHIDLAGLTDFLYLQSTNYACQREFGHYYLTWTPNLFWQRLKDELFRIFCQQYGISDFHAIKIRSSRFSPR